MPGSIKSCTRSFLSNLQDGYPSTVPTVFRTGNKLLPYKYKDNIDTGDNLEQLCGFCNGPLDCNQTEASALYATMLSQKLSTLTVSNQNTTNCTEESKRNGFMHTSCLTDEEKGDESLFKYMEFIRQEDFHSIMCYGCRITLKSVVSMVIIENKPSELNTFIIYIYRY